MACLWITNPEQLEVLKSRAKKPATAFLNFSQYIHLTASGCHLVTSKSTITH
jgi:hypothetical protein